MSDTSFGNSGAWLVATPWDHGAIELNNGVIIKRNQSGLQYGVFHNKSTDLLEMDHHGDYMMQCVRLYFEKQSVCHTSRMLPLKAVHLAEKKTPYSYDYSWWMCVCVCVCVCACVCARITLTVGMKRNGFGRWCVFVCYISALYQQFWRNHIHLN